MNYELRPVTLADHLAEETVGERTPAQVEGPIPTPDELRELERMAAADKIDKMRRVREFASTWPEITRMHYATSFEALSLQFAAASAYLRRPRPDEVPECWRVG